MNNNSNNCGDCGTTCSECGRPWAICKQDGGCGCNKCKDIKFCEYGRMANGCIREKQPGCPMQAVIPSVTVESIEGIKNLADCLVHVSDINTTFYIDDKHRPIITWAGPIDIPGYDMEGNPNNYRDQIVTDVANQMAVIYDKSGKGYMFGLAENIDFLAKYLVICGGNAKELGCAGDGTTDDTSALQNAIDQMHSLGINKLVIPSGEFVVSDKIELPSNFELKGMKGSVIKYVGMGADEDHPYAILPIINIVGSEDLPKTNVTVEDITIDCTGQIFKGGHTFEAPANTNPQPASQGLRGININFATNTIIKNCRILDLYGDGIRIDHSHSIIVDGNKLNDVGGGNIIGGGPTGWDNFGDGIVSFSSFDVKIINNTVINTRKYLSGASVGYICGRSGLEYEYGLQTDGINTPGQELFVEKSGNGLVSDNNYVYGYTKGIHLESGVKCIITNNTVIHNNIGMMNSTAGRTVISGNYFNQDDVGPAYQSGYDRYYGGIAVSEYVSQYPTANCVEVNNNIFDGDSTGVHIGRDYVSVNNNTFRGQGEAGAIRNIKTNLRGLSVNGNQFFNCGVHLYHTRGSNIANNVFDNTTNYCVLCEECDNTIVSGNEFNHRVTFTSDTFNTSIIGNTFYAPSDIDASYTQMLTMNQTARNALIEGNNINLVDNNDIVFLNIAGSINARIKNNNIRVASSRTEKVIYLAGGGKDIDIENNVFIGCGYKATLIISSWDIIGFTLVNNILDEPTSFLCAQTGGGIAGQSRIEHNIGNLNLPTNNAANSEARLKNRFIQQGDIITRFVASNNIIGVYCSQGGYYVTDEWTASTAYTRNKLVKRNDYVYKCLTSGTATVAPTNTTIGNDETGADGVKWVCVSKLATLRNVVIS